MPQTYYDVLEVSPAASPETIRAAYKSLMQRNHPDRRAGGASDEQAKRINVAYQVLSDERQRAAYDAHLKSRPAPTPEATGTPPARKPVTLTPQQIEALLKPRRSWRWLQLTLLGVIAVAAFLIWRQTRPEPRLLLVGTAPFAQGVEPLDVLIDTSTIRRIGDQAQLVMLFRPHDGKPFLMAGESVLGATQVVAYDCSHRGYSSWQKRLALADGSSVPLPDAHGEVAPASAHDAALERACLPWWRR